MRRSLSQLLESDFVGSEKSIMLTGPQKDDEFVKKL